MLGMGVVSGNKADFFAAKPIVAASAWRHARVIAANKAAVHRPFRGHRKLPFIHSKFEC